MDLPIKELMAHANDFLSRCPKAKVFFKFTCDFCNNRCTFSEANTLFEEGECHHCGHVTKIEKGGYLVHFGE